MATPHPFTKGGANARSLPTLAGAMPVSDCLRNPPPIEPGVASALGCEDAQLTLLWEAT